MSRWSRSRRSSHHPSRTSRRNHRDRYRRSCGASLRVDLSYQWTDGFCWSWVDRRAFPLGIFFGGCFVVARLLSTYRRPTRGCSISFSSCSDRSDNFRWTNRDSLPPDCNRTRTNTHCLRPRRSSTIGSSAPLSAVACSWWCSMCYSLSAHTSSTFFNRLFVFAQLWKIPQNSTAISSKMLSPATCCFAEFILTNILWNLTRSHSGFVLAPHALELLLLIRHQICCVTIKLLLESLVNLLIQRIRVGVNRFRIWSSISATRKKSQNIARDRKKTFHLRTFLFASQLTTEKFWQKVFACRGFTFSCLLNR